MQTLEIFYDSDWTVILLLELQTMTDFLEDTVYGIS
jgi:hypothetical protein